MALASETIRDAYRESNLLALGSEPTTAQQTEGLSRLNSILLAAIGTEAGEELYDISVGGSYDQSACCSEFVPENARLVLNLDSARTMRLHPQPYDGQRVAIADAAGNLATYNLTFDGNGRRIEGQSTLTLSTNGDARQWMYRADLGDWKRITALELGDALPFPQEFDDYFVILLAMRLNPRYGLDLAATSASWLEDTANRLEARYRRPRDIQGWPTLGLYGQRNQAYGSSGGAFNRGRPWR